MSTKAGTNIQEGLHVARQKLKQSTAENKIIIVLTDGAPNRAYDNYATGSKKFGFIKIDTYDPTTTISKEEANEYNIGTDYRILYAEKDFKYNSSSVDESHLGHKEDRIQKKTVSEALFAKRDGYDVYAIGFGIDNDGRKVLQSVASKGMYYDSGISETEITGVFNKIAQNVKNYCAYDPKVTDVIGTDFDYYEDNTHKPSQTITKSADNRTLTWNVGNHLDENVKTLTFYVKYKNVNDPADPSANGGKLDTNNEAKLTYKTEKEGTEEKTLNIDLANSKVPNLAKKVTYTVTGEDRPANAPAAPAADLIWKGKTYNVKATLSSSETSKGEETGSWKFDGWKLNGKEKTEIENVTTDIELTGEWKFTENAKYGVEYEYVSSDPTDHPLPDAISTPDGTGDYAVSDTDTYYVGDKVTRKNPNSNTYTDNENHGTWTLTWDKDKAEMTKEGVTFTGTWTFTANEQVTLHYEIVVKDAGAPQPAAGTVTEPRDQTDYSGKSFDVAGEATTTDNTYKWTFRGWYRDRECTNLVEGASITLTEDTTLYGYWTSEAKVGAYTVTEFLMQANGEYDAGTEIVTDGTHALGEMTYTPDATKPGGYTLNTEQSKLTKEITADGTAEFKVYYDLSSGSKVTKVAKVNGNMTDQAEVGDTIDYYITVSNVGGLDLKSLTLTDTFNRADLHFDESATSAYTVTPVEGEEGKWTITIPSLTVAEGSITIHATYKVVDTDSGRMLRNTVGGTNNDTDGDSTVAVGEVTHNNVVIDIEKTVTSKRGTAPKEGYVFVAYYKDKFDGAEHELGRTTIYMSESATKDDPKTETGKIRFMLSEEEYKQLSTENEVPYLFVKELPGEDAFTEYDSTVLKGFIFEEPSAYSILPDEPTYNEVEYIVVPETYPISDVFAFENIYKKPTSRVDPIKVGPQLNRDDHVAYIMGYPDGRVRPEGEITRAEACTIFFRLLTDSSRDYYFSKTNDYTDVARGDWFNNAISTLSNAGIVTGYNDGTFRPNQPITRGEMAKIIANFANLKNGGKTFTDLRGHWSKTYVELAAGNGWIAGYPDGSFRPDQKITRAETVTMINRVLERVPAKESRLLSRSIMLTFPDNKPGDWYYIAIQEASNSHEYQRSVYETTGDEMWTKLIDNVDWTKLEK